MVTLSPCPFCYGRNQSYRKDFAEDDPTHCYAFHVRCDDCGARGRNSYPIGWCETEEMAADAWNDREPPRFRHVGYATEYGVKEVERGANRTLTVNQERSPLRPIPIFVGRAERADD